MKKFKKLRWPLILLGVGALAYRLLLTGEAKTENPYMTVRITKGPLKQIVTATGEIRPLNTISIGSQVTGIIEKIFVDFNSVVRQGDILLEIDPVVLKATADESKAQLDSARAQLRYDQAEYNRANQLYKSGFIAKSELEMLNTRFETSRQTVNRTQSQYDRAVANLGFATIRSPVNGTIISRKVDVGQTIVSAMNTAVLFEVAEDLTKMQIQAAISEADIGMIRIDQPVTFTVDAYPSRTFNGTVKQIRLVPTTTQNVVIYTVIIDVANDDLLLMPGMTAFVTVLIQEKEDVWRAENSAFLVRNYRNILPDNPDVQSGAVTPQNTLLVLRGNDVLLIPYKRGLATSTETEIVADGIERGDLIITGKRGITGVPATGVGMPRAGGQMGGGMGGGGGRR